MISAALGIAPKQTQVNRYTDRPSKSQRHPGGHHPVGERYTVGVPVTGQAGRAIERTGWLLEAGSTSPKVPSTLPSQLCARPPLTPL